MSFTNPRFGALAMLALASVLSGSGRSHHGAVRRVVVGAIVDTTRYFTSDSVYELQGTVVVGPGATLVIEAGTRIEGDPATRGALVIAIGGNLIARGTPLEPIVFTCSAAIKTPGCWGGVAIAGLAPLNNGVMTPEHVECPVKAHPAIPGDYGGCLPQDTSGALRYVRIEYAGMAPPGGSPVPALALLGVGSGTTVDSLQIHASLDDALHISGGYADLRGIVVTAPGTDGLDWNDGWHGRAQFVLVQLSNGGGGGGAAIRGSNVTAGTTMIGTRSDPRLSHITIVGTGPAASIVLEDGTAAEIANAIVFGSGGPGLEIQGTESCDQANGSAMPGIRVHHSIFFGSTPPFSTDADCVDEEAYALDAARANRLVDPQIPGAPSTNTMDMRPAVTSPAQTGYTMMPPDGFFDTNPQFVGAVMAATSGGGNIPWYAGWTRGWSVTP